MENLDFGTIAIATTIVGAFNLIIILLVRTETILKAVERIKGVIGLGYKDRAKRSDDEIKLSKKHALVAKERVRHSFVAFAKFGCAWVWNWSEDFEPINIKGYCLAHLDANFWDREAGYKCNYSVEPYYQLPQTDDEGNEINPSNFIVLAISCTNRASDSVLHRKRRAEFKILKSTFETMNSFEAFEPIISKAIIGERDLKVAVEIKKLKSQFWR